MANCLCPPPRFASPFCAPSSSARLGEVAVVVDSVCTRHAEYSASAASCRASKSISTIRRRRLLLLPPTLVGTARAVPTGPASITRQEIVLPNADELRRGGFAFVLHDVFSPAECVAMIAASEARGYDQALINTGFAQVLDRSYRNSMRNIWDDHETAAEIHRRIAPYLPNEAERHSFGYRAKPALQKCEGLNERLRFLRYDPGDFFAAHQDGSYERPDRSARSYLTVMLYLNSGGDVDFSGGETSFVSRTGAQPDVALVPRAGDVLVFTHPVLHQGNKVTKGRKYAVRTDVMYSFNESGTGLAWTRARIGTSCFR